jgi:hypothetical protein
MHRCTRSCFKYCHPGKPLECRSHFPYDPEGPSNQNTPVIHAYHDAKCRRQVRVLPKRNNAYLNGTVISALLTLCIGGNHDLQYISNITGAAEYVASYTTKHDLPDFKLISNFLYKRLQKAFTDQKRLQAVATSVLDSTTVGAMEAMYLLLDLDLVEKTREVDNINPLHRNQLSKNVEIDTIKLQNMDGEDKPYKAGLKSHSGKRQAYELLMKQQRTDWGNCHITFYALLANFTMAEFNSNTKTQSKLSLPPLLHIDEWGKIANTDIDSFRIENIVFKKRKKNAVLNPCPYIPIDKLSDVSCYATLLLHVPWPPGGEADIAKSMSPVNRLKEAENNKELASYAEPLLKRIKRSHQLLEQQDTLAQENRQHHQDDDNNDDDEEEMYCPCETSNIPYDDDQLVSKMF